MTKHSDKINKFGFAQNSLPQNGNFVVEAITNQTIAFGFYIPALTGPCLVNLKNGFGVLNFGHAKIEAPSYQILLEPQLMITSIGASNDIESESIQ